MDIYWICTVKHQQDGIVEKLKARLVAKQYAPTYDVDYFKAFSYVAKLNFIHVIISIKTNLNWQLSLSNVRKVFPA